MSTTYDPLNEVEVPAGLHGQELPRHWRPRTPGQSCAEGERPQSDRDRGPEGTWTPKCSQAGSPGAQSFPETRAPPQGVAAADNAQETTGVACGLASATERLPGGMRPIEHPVSADGVAEGDARRLMEVRELPAHELYTRAGPLLCDHADISIKGVGVLASDAFRVDQWRDYFIVVGSGAAALTGLIFVAMSLNVSAVTANTAHRYRGVGSLIGLASVFMLSALVVMGGQGHSAVGTELVVVSCVAGALIVRDHVHTRGFRGGRSRRYAALAWGRALATCFRSREGRCCSPMRRLLSASPPSQSSPTSTS